MKISDEQIKEIVKRASINVRPELKPWLEAGDPYIDYEFMRELIALAQEVGELKFVDTGSRWIASSIFGYYTIVPTGFEYDVFYSEYVPDGVHVTKLRTIEGMSNAMEAAQQDYAKRVLSCLVNGGV